MLNAEKFKDELLDILSENRYIEVNKYDRKIRKCTGNNCPKCMFGITALGKGKDSCSIAAMLWLLSEYKEPIKLSRLEYEILKYVQKKGFNFITRNNSDYLYGDLYGNLFIHENKPIKHDSSMGWCTASKSYVLYAFNDLFQFIKWEDEEPTSIEDVLNSCEVVNDD